MHTIVCSDYVGFFFFLYEPQNAPVCVRNCEVITTLGQYMVACFRPYCFLDYTTVILMSNKVRLRPQLNCPRSK